MKPEKLRIVYFSFFSLPGRGTHNIQIMNMCSALTKIPGVKVSLISPSQSDSKLDVLKTDIWNFYGLEENFEILFTPDKYNFRNSNDLLKKIYKVFFTLFFAVSHLKKIDEKFIIYSRTTKLAGFFKLIAKILRMKNYKGFFCELHSIPEHKFFLDRAEGLIFISNSLKKETLAKYPELSGDGIIVAHDGFNLTVYSDSIVEAREKLSLPLDKVIITYTGRINREKGAEDLIEAFSRLGRKENLLLLMVGKIYSDEFEKKVKELNLTDCVIFTGFVAPSEIKHYLHSSDILVFSSTNELTYSKFTSPLKLFEYMGAKKPIVASALDGIKEVIKPGFNGILYNSSNINELVEGLNYLLNDKSEAERLANNAYSNSLNYTWNKRAENIFNFITENV